MELHSDVKKLHLQEKQLHVCCTCFKLYLGNWMTDRFWILSVAESKEPIMDFVKLQNVPGFHSAGHKCTCHQKCCNIRFSIVSLSSWLMHVHNLGLFVQYTADSANYIHRFLWLYVVGRLCKALLAVKELSDSGTVLGQLNSHGPCS